MYTTQVKWQWLNHVRDKIVNDIVHGGNKGKCNSKSLQECSRCASVAFFGSSGNISIRKLFYSHLTILHYRVHNERNFFIVFTFQSRSLYFIKRWQGLSEGHTASPREEEKTETNATQKNSEKYIFQSRTDLIANANYKQSNGRAKTDIISQIFKANQEIATKRAHSSA